MNPLDSWTEEQRAAFLYRACADAETGTVRAELFRRLAGEAEAQAAIWRAQLTSRGHPAPGPFVPDARTRLVAGLVQWLGPRRLRNVLAAMKQAADQNLKTIGLSGKDGGLLAKVSDVSVTVPAANTARIQECHIAIGHIWCELVEFDQRLRRLAA